MIHDLMWVSPEGVLSCNWCLSDVLLLFHVSHMSETCPAFFTIVLFLLRVCVSKHLEPISWVKRTDHLIAMPSFLLSSNSVCLCVCVFDLSRERTQSLRDYQVCCCISCSRRSNVAGDEWMRSSVPSTGSSRVCTTDSTYLCPQIISHFKTNNLTMKTSSSSWSIALHDCVCILRVIFIVSQRNKWHDLYLSREQKLIFQIFVVLTSLSEEGELCYFRLHVIFTRLKKAILKNWLIFLSEDLFSSWQQSREEESK